jgi:CRISPR-associated protein Cmr6
MRQHIVKLGDSRDRGQHAGLLLQRYLSENATGDNGKPEEKQRILQAAIKAAADGEVRELYRLAFERWKESLPKMTTGINLETDGRLIVGLGAENVLETGIRLHHTYGMPFLPGSALKGLAAHYCNQVWGETDDSFKYGGDYHHLLFGTTDESGCIVFHDALFIPSSEPKPLRLDVMTPHHPKWLDGSVAPTDFDSPTPVPFLSVVGQFHVAVSWFGPDDEEGLNWTKLTLSLLKKALEEWGIGGKTTSGYGRLSPKSANGSPQLKSLSNPRLSKRASGTRTEVRIIGIREKGFEVQEEGRPQGTLTVGIKPADIQANIGDIVQVQIKTEEGHKPEYQWPRNDTPQKTTNQGRSRR